MATQWYGIMHLQVRSEGWAESFNFRAGTANVAAAMAALNLLIDTRRATLPASASIIHARVGIRGNPRERFKVARAYPLAGTSNAAASGYTPTVADVNDVPCAARFTHTTASGRWRDQILRALPDDVVFGGALVAPIPDLTPDTLIAPLTTWYDAMHNHVVQTRLLVHLAKLVTPASGSTPADYSAEVFTLSAYEKITRRKTGVPFGQSRGRAPVGG